MLPRRSDLAGHFRHSFRALASARYAELSLCVPLLVAVLLVSGPRAANAEIGVSSAVVGGAFVYAVRKGDSLIAISARHGVDERILALDNGLSPPYLLRVGDRLRVYNRHVVPEVLADGILINIPQRMLYLFRDSKLAASYPVALGRRDWPTPTGDFSVTQLARNKTWCVPASIQEEMRRAGKAIATRVPPGPDNPLGEFWIGLSAPGYGIHSTIAPMSIYRMRTHGCVRMHPQDAAALYPLVSINMPVRIIYAPVLMAKLEGPRILVEANPDVYNHGVDPLQVLRRAARAAGLEDGIDWAVVEHVVSRREGIAREVGGPADASGESGGRRIHAGYETEPAALHRRRDVPRTGGGGTADHTRQRGADAGRGEGAALLQHPHG